MTFPLSSNLKEKLKLVYNIRKYTLKPYKDYLIYIYSEMTEIVKAKQFYFDDLVKDNILSFIPTKEYLKVGQFYNKMFFFDDETFRISEEYYSINIMKITKCYIYFLVDLQPDLDPFILQKKKKKDDKGEYVKFIEETK